MFENAFSFNQNLSFWVVGNVENATRMFGNATSFNQNLCQWEVLVDIAEVDVADMFLGSGCDVESDPTNENWCQSCNEVLV